MSCARPRDTSALEREPALRSEASFARAHESPSLSGAWITLAGSRAYLSTPRAAARASTPGIVLIHTARGLNRDMQLWADRFAEEGYAAIAVDLYRGRSATRREDAIALRDDANTRVDENKAILRAAYDHLATAPEIRADRRALVGWSYGGGWATLMATELPGVSAVVAHYGVADLDADAIAKIAHSTLLVCGDRDDVREDVAALATTLREAHKRVGVLMTHADHGFTDPSNDAYDAASAERAYDAVRSFLDASLRHRSQ